MKKLICADDMNNFILKGEKIIILEKDCIVTPSAKDIAKVNGIEITKKEEISNSNNKISNKLNDVTGQNILEMLKMMIDEGLLQEMIKALKNQKNQKFIAECDKSGLKVVKGNTVKMDVFDTGNPNAKAYYQELVSKEESKMSSGFLVIENSKFEWELTYEEIDYVIEGTVTVEINNKTYTANEGDILFVPAGSKVIWGSPNKAKLFYTTYPANWADLM